MTFLSLQPFVPSGPDFNASKELFIELGFEVKWDAGDYAGLEKDGCSFILQKYDNRQFAENLMISVAVGDLKEFWNMLNEKQVAQKFGVHIGAPTEQPYGLEVNMIDIAGVCWHFVQ